MNILLELIGLIIVGFGGVFAFIGIRNFCSKFFRKPSSGNVGATILERLKSEGFLVLGSRQILEKFSNVQKSGAWLWNRTDVHLLMQGDVDIGIDLQQLQLADYDKSTATLSLPRPSRRRPRICFDRSVEYIIKKCFFGPKKEDAVLRAQMDFYEKIQHEPIREDEVEALRMQADTAINKILGKGGRGLRIIWKSNGQFSADGGSDQMGGVRLLA